jgi:hypothetical protein
MTLPFDCINPDLIAFYSTELYSVRVYQLDCKNEIKRINKPSWARELMIGERFFLRGMFLRDILIRTKRRTGSLSMAMTICRLLSVSNYSCVSHSTSTTFPNYFSP